MKKESIGHSFEEMLEAFQKGYMFSRPMFQDSIPENTITVDIHYNPDSSKPFVLHVTHSQSGTPCLKGQGLVIRSDICSAGQA